MVTLGGATFVWRGNDQDYCFMETIECLTELCDEIQVAAGGADGTWEGVFLLMKELSEAYPEKKFGLIQIIQEEWDSQQGREKLSHFSNMAISALSTDYVFYLQCDEILHEDSFPYVRAAIETGCESFFVQRLNLWKDAGHMLNVPQERKPCSTEVIRLAKARNRCVDDAESLGVTECYLMGNIEDMQIFHVGFIRDKVKHLVKIRHMLVDVFQFGENDKRAENCDVFIPERFFSDDDIIPIPRPLPKFIRHWCEERYPTAP
jgi:hypothetical protein